MSKKLLNATHGSNKTPIKLGTIKIPCYVLEDGTRVLSGRGIQGAIGSTATSGTWLNRFINKPEISNFFQTGILEKLNNPISFNRPSAGGSQSITYGYEATLFIDIIEAIEDAFKTGVPIDENIIKSISILSKALKRVSIIALVDEATGYQYEREKDELQKILKVYISEELLQWQKTFPDTYYYEIFRLNGWDYTVGDIKKRPGVVGRWTNKVIYEQLPQGVLKELKEKTPKSDGGNYTHRFFQSLTPDTGHPHLSAQLNQVIAIMRISDNWQQFIVNFNKMVDRKNGQMELQLSDLKPIIEVSETKLKDTKPLGDFDKVVKKFLDTPPPKKEK